MLHRQDHAEARASAHHPIVGGSGANQRKSFDHRPNSTDCAEPESVLRIGGGAGRPASHRPARPDERDRVHFHRTHGGSDHHQGAVHTEALHQRAHRLAIGRGGENRFGATELQEHIRRFFKSGIDVVVGAELTDHLLLFCTASDGYRFKAHLARELHAKMTEAADSLNGD